MNMLLAYAAFASIWLASHSGPATLLVVMWWAFAIPGVVLVWPFLRDDLNNLLHEAAPPVRAGRHQ